MHRYSAKRFNIYTVKTASGISFNLEASTYSEACARANDPVIAEEIARMMKIAVSNVSRVELFQGPMNLANRKLVFQDRLFRKQP